jgi:nucleoside-diphosphate-sugar epimerase
MSRMTNEDPEGVDTPIGQPVVAITGAGGYLGSVLVAALGSAGYTVRRLLRSPGSGSGDHHFDLSSVASCDALDGVDLLVHCAYDMTLTSRAAIWQTNVFGTVALFDRALSLGVRRTIALSSMSAYPGTRQLYGRAKLAVEAAALDRGLCVVRPGLVYGAGGGGMAGTLHRLATLPVLPDFGPRAHQFTVSEQDFAAALVALAGAERLPAFPVGIAHPEPVLFTELLTSFAVIEGKSQPRFVRVPPMAVYGALRATEFLPIKLPVRADSLLGLVRPAPNVPNLEVLDQLGVVLHPFAIAGTGSLEEDDDMSTSSEPD